jgi:hypothetical protein
MIKDTETRVESLFDRLASSTVSDIVLARLILISKDVQRGDYNAAQQHVYHLVSLNLEESRWLVGLKRLVDSFI